MTIEFDSSERNTLFLNFPAHTAQHNSSEGTEEERGNFQENSIFHTDHLRAT